VVQELGGRIPLIVDGGQTTHGLESTIVAVQNGHLEILRSGPTTEEQLRGIGCQPMRHRPAADATIIRAPGQLRSHYAPQTRLRLIENAGSFSPQANHQVGLLAWEPFENRSGFAAVRILSEKQDLREAAANLFRYVRELDNCSLDLIVAELVPEHGLGVAINDRLRRAAEK
jgi:L-threonylcarbamoyladenylate synthase